MRVVQSRWNICAFLLLGVLLFSPNAHAGLYTLGRPRAATEGADFPIVEGAADLLRPALADGKVIIWYGEGADGADIFGLRLDESGHAVDEPFVINNGDDATWRRGDQSTPTIAHNTSSGGYLVAWHSRPSAAAEFDVYARYLDDEGHPLGAPIAVAVVAGDQLRPDVAYLPQADRFVIVWQDGRDAPISGFDVYARTAPGAGPEGGAWSREWMVSAAERDQTIPSVACENAGAWCLVAWMDDQNDEVYHTDIAARLVDAAAGVSLGERIDVAVERGYQDSPSIIYNAASGEYLVVWNDDISARRVSRDGKPIGGRINVSRESPFQYKPAVALDADGNYLIIWEDGRNQARRGMDIYAQWLSPRGTRIGRNFALSTDPHQQYWPAIAFDATRGEFLAVWEDDRGGDGLALYGRRFIEP